MAYIHWRRGKQVTVYYYDKNTGKQIPLPRKQTKHLDGMPKDEVVKWVEDWERKHGKTVNRSERMHLREDDLLATLWRLYQTYRMKMKNRSEATAKTETENFEKHVVAFFVKKHQKKDPADWHPLVPAFHDHLFEIGLADTTIQKILWSLERFGKYLVFRRHMTFPFVIYPPARENMKITPLKVERSPEDILTFVKNAQYTYKDIDFNLAVLLGYFAALRPSELFALEKADLLTGENSLLDCKTAAGFKKHGLGSRLSVAIYKALTPDGNVKTQGSRDIVHIWNADAAKAIAKLVKDKPDGRLFPFSIDWLERAWKDHVKSKLGVTPHDLRRASCLWLGREKRIEVTLLQDHMRHAEIETTLLYTRRPNPIQEKVKKSIQNFDDVA